MAKTGALPLQGELEFATTVIRPQAYGAHKGASTTDRELGAWRVTRESADAELLPDLDNLVARSRDIERNNGLAESGFTTIHDNVLGSGLRLSPRPNYLALGWEKERADEWSAIVRELWDAYYWTTKCDAADEWTGDQLTAIQLRSYMANGEALALPLWLPERGDGFATKIHLVESDRLCNPAFAPDSDTLRGGIRLGKYGERLGYYFAKTHPGDRFLGVGQPMGADGWTYVPRKTPFGRLRVLHLYDPKRVGQTRGRPLLTSILPLFKNLDRYQGAELQAALVNALVAMTIETPSTHEQVMEWFGGNADKYLEWREKSVVELRAGNILTLFPGDKASGFMPARPATAYEAFVVALLRQIALAFDMPYEMLVKDWSRLNYVTLRAALEQAWKAFNRRRDFVTSHWLDPWYDLWFEEQVDAGKIEAPDFGEQRWAYTRCRWMGPGRGPLDPAREAVATEKRLAIGVSTLEDECAELGRDWREVMEQRATEKEMAASLGLTIGAPAPGQQPGQQAAAPGEPAAPQPGDVNEDPDKIGQEDKTPARERETA